MADDEPISFIVDPGNKFSDAVAKAAQEVQDLTIPLQLIAKQWFKSNQALFALKSAGKFEDLSEEYQDQKERQVGFIYPILRRSGMLERSITNPSNGDAISVILNKNSLIMGTRVEYAPYLHFGTSKMPERPFVMIGAEQTGPEEFNMRQEAWIKTIQSYVDQKLAQVGTVKTNG